MPKKSKKNNRKKVQPISKKSKEEGSSDDSFESLLVAVSSFLGAAERLLEALARSVEIRSSRKE